MFNRKIDQPLAATYVLILSILRRLPIILVFGFTLLTASACAPLPKPGAEVENAAEIEAFFHKWQGTRYRFGGASQSGVDCSALMVAVYQDVYNINLPRTTEKQSKLGSRVRLSRLKTGDLVFFKTGITRRHVGIYLYDGLFVHASQSSGVIKSSLKSGYWQDHLWKVKRITN